MVWCWTAAGWASLILALAASTPAAAQKFPDRPITLTMPFPPGGGTDAVARVVVDGMAERLGQPVVIENKPGAAGTIGMAMLARAPADGYTIAVTNNPPLTMNMFMQKNFPYDPRTAFTPISLMAETPLIMAVHESVPATSIAELVAYARKNPGRLSFGSAGVGTGHHIAGELLKQAADIDLVHVPYRGTAQLLQDLAGGAIQVGFGTPTALVPFAAIGKIRIIAIAESKRSADFPGVPTIAETYPSVVTNTWVGMFGPAGMPAAVLDQINGAVNAALRNPDIATKLKLQGWDAVGSTPEKLAGTVDGELKHWAKTMPAVGLRPE